MCSPNTACLKSFKNKHTKSKRVLLKHIKQCAMKTSARLQSTIEHNFIMSKKNKKYISIFECALMIFIVICLVSSPISAVEIEESQSITINKIRSHQPWVSFSTDYVRCFCNFPSCVSTGYMCKSSGGGCFSNFLDHSGPPQRSNDYRGRHGCLELLTDKEQRSWCEDNPTSNLSHKKKNDSKSLIMCCYHDMCNHVDSPQTKNLINNTLLGSLLVDTPENVDRKFGGNPGNQRQERTTYSNSEIWFRAATIAVPICGAVILFVLIALAIKMLRGENQNSSNHKLGPPCYIKHFSSHNTNKNGCEKYPQNHMDRTYDILRPVHHHPRYDGDDFQRIQVPLLVQNDSCIEEKNEANAKMNLIHCENYLESNKFVLSNIEKELAPKCLEVNLSKTSNCDVKYSNVNYINESKKNVNFT